MNSLHSFTGTPEPFGTHTIVVQLMGMVAGWGLGLVLRTGTARIDGLVSDLNLEADLAEGRGADLTGAGTDDGRTVAQVADGRADGVAVDDAPVLGPGVLGTAQRAAQEQALHQRLRAHRFSSSPAAHVPLVTNKRARAIHTLSRRASIHARRV